MNPLVASLLVRQQIALVDEGIGPKNPQDYDSSIMNIATDMMLEAGEINIHAAWDNMLIEANDPRHPNPCDDTCYPGWSVNADPHSQS